MSASLRPAPRANALAQLPAELEAWRPRLEGRKFVWILSPSWNSIWTRQNHFATRLAQLGAEVLYVENPSSWTSTLKQKRWRDLPLGCADHVREVQPGLHVMRPALSLPGGKRWDAVARINGRWTARRIEQWIRERGWTGYLAWCRLPHSYFVVDRLEPNVTVYDVTDDYAAYEANLRIRTRVTQHERKLLSHANIVFIAAPPLREKLDHPDCHWIPNGLDYELFAQAREPGEVHPLVASMGKPVIGFVGLTSDWIDFELLATLGQRWPNKILMLGPVAADVEKRARSISGLIWGGFVPQPKLPPYLRGFDVCIMPYQLNEHTRNSSPLKMWEYVAAGKPLVSVNLPALEPIRKFVDVARDRSHFVELVQQRLNSQAAPSGNVASLAKSYSWNNIFQQMLQQLETKL